MTFSDTAAVTDVATVIRPADPLAIRTTVTNLGPSLCRIYEAGVMVAVLYPNQSRVLPKQGIMAISGKCDAGDTATISCQTVERCDCENELRPFDFAVIRYRWDVTNGTDLDTRTAVMQPAFDNSGQDVGWHRLSSVLGDAGAYLWWGGDNTTPTGDEATLVDFKALQQDFPSTRQFIIRLRAFWFHSREDGNFQIEFETYKGGTMSQSGLDFINTGGETVQKITVDRNSATLKPVETEDEDGDEMGLLIFNASTSTGVITNAR